MMTSDRWFGAGNPIAWVHFAASGGVTGATGRPMIRSGCGKRWSLTASAGSEDGKSSGKKGQPRSVRIYVRRRFLASRAGELAAQHPVRRGVARSGRVLPVGDGVVQGREQL